MFFLVCRVSLIYFFIFIFFLGRVFRGRGRKYKTIFFSFFRLVDVVFIFLKIFVRKRGEEGTERMV